jgi:acyl-CoA thioesterase I
MIKEPASSRASFMVVFLVISGLWFATVVADEKPVLILGDSLSAGYGISMEESWPSLLQKRLQEEGYRQQVVNASISGETTKGGARRLGALIIKYKPGTIVIALGANDGLRGINGAEIRKNLTQMINAAKLIGAAVVLVKVRVPPNYGPDYTDAFEGVFDQLGADHEILYAPFMLERFAANANSFQQDGLHPTADVQPLILDTLWPSIVEALGNSGGLEEFY